MKKLLISILRLSSLLMFCALMAGGDVAAAAFGALAAFFPVVLMALGALRQGRLGRIWLALVPLVVLLEVGFWTMLELRGSVQEAPWIFGLPAAAAVLLWVFCLTPLLLISFAYAWTFEEHGVTQEGLERLRRVSASRAAAGPSADS